MIIKESEFSDYQQEIVDYANLIGRDNINNIKEDYYIKQLFGVDENCDVSKLDDIKLLGFLYIQARWEYGNDTQLGLENDFNTYFPDCYVKKLNSIGVNINTNPT